MEHDITLYVGLDVHKDSITVAYAIGMGEVVVPRPYLYAGILVFATIGVYGMRQSWFDLVGAIGIDSRLSEGTQQAISAPRHPVTSAKSDPAGLAQR
ncbi:hypothetical protein CTP10_R72400 (plasmid) [Cupriavidus sp. P-10]|uniref:hypothetical protein n=1 Tax=Cupriavidus sp. P-10 TaxID=2027911 RepID=UPI001313FF1D|nr:hypothetical protein [Cupriavidus sp. P-10]BDB29824.1 hypothetical protein CTP10_R72400 [Cupriavidus sp. P-10]